MKSRPADVRMTPDTRRETGASATQGDWRGWVAFGAFVLLAAGLCVRSILGEMPDTQITDLISPPAAKWSASSFVTYVAYLGTAAGVLLSMLWTILSRRDWRCSGLEVGAILFIAAALLAVPVASEKRLALNTAIDTILPLVAAASLYQLLAGDLRWRRAALAVLVATAAGQCWKATAQHSWEYQQEWQDYQQNKAAFWGQQGVGLNDPLVTVYEASKKSQQPVGYYRHPNVLASFLLLGLGGAGAAIAGSGKPRSSRLKLAAIAGLAGLILWDLVILGWVHSLGATVGLAAAILAGAVAWRYRQRPGRVAIGLVLGLAILQATLTGLGVRATSLYPALAEHGGKVASLAVRLNYWDAAARMFTRHSLTGVGPGQFRRHYNATKPVYAAEETFHPHNWLLATGAEWGIFGVLGILAALGGTGWAVLRSLPDPTGETDRSATSVLAAAVPAVLACWLLAASDLPDNGWVAAGGALTAGLAAMAAASTSWLRGRLGQAILLAALVAFVVHTTVEMASGTPGAMWPFWMTLALAMAWGSPTQVARGLTQDRLGLAGLTLAGLVTIAAAVLSIQPLRAGLLMHEAQLAIAAEQPDRNVQLLREAAAIDPLDPNPLSAAGMLCSQMASRNRSQDLHYMREAVDLYQAAAQRDPLRYVLWRNLAAGTMRLARRLGDTTGMQKALDLKYREIQLYPNNPQGWFELARMAMMASQSLPDRPDLPRLVMESLDRAELLDKARPDHDIRGFGPSELTQVRRMRESLARSLPTTETRPVGTQPAR